MKNLIVNLIPSKRTTLQPLQFSLKNYKLKQAILVSLLSFFAITSSAASFVVFEGFPDNTTDNTSNLNSVLPTCDTLYIPAGGNYYKIAGTVNVPAGKTIIFESGAKFNVTGNLKGVETYIIAEETEIFSNSSIIKGTWATDKIFSAWTGAVGDGETNDYASLNLFFNLLGIFEHNQALLGVNKQYYIKNQILNTVINDINVDGRGSRIFRKYADMATGESILRFTGSVAMTKTVTENLVNGQFTMVVNNTSGLTEGMGIELISNELFGKEYMGGSSWHYHYKGMLSKIVSISGNTITMADSIPHDFLASEVASVKFFNVIPVSIKNLNFGSENITGTNKMNQLVVSQLFDVELDNITCNPLGYSGLSIKSIYNGYFNNITCLKPGAGEDDNIFGVYGIVPDLNVNCVYDSLYMRATTHGIAFTNEPSYNVVVKNSDFKASWYGSNGVDSHASKWVKFQNCIIYGAQGNWGTFIFENCEMYEVANGLGNIWNEREGASRGNLQVYFTNCNFYTQKNGSKLTSIFYRYPTVETSTNKYTIVDNNFYLENDLSYLFNKVSFGTATDIQPILVENNNFYGTGTLYLPQNYSNTPATNGGVFTFKNNTYSLIKWTTPPFDQFQSIEIVDNTPVNEDTSDFWINWDNRPGNITFSGNVLVGTCIWIKDCTGNISFDNNEIYNNLLKSTSTYKDRNYLTGNANLTFTNNNLYNNYWTLTGNQLVSGNSYNGKLQPGLPSANWEDIYTPGTSIETSVTMEGISDYTIISLAKMDDITTNAVQNLVGSSVTKLYLGFNPSGTTPVSRPSIRNEDGTIVRPVLSKYYLDKEWHTYVFTMENGILKGYMDGIAMLAYDASNVYNKMYATGTIQIGGINSTETWNGPIKTFAIYNRVLSLEEANNFAENPGLTLTGQIYKLVNMNNMSPVGHWAFDETTGYIVNDSSENNIQGTLVNGPIRVEGIKNNAITLDGINDNIDFGNNPVLDMGEDDFTLSAWVKMNESQVYYPTFASKGGSSQKNAGYWFFLSNSKLYLLLGDGQTRIAASSSIVSINDNSWHHVAVSADRNGNATFYIDGSVVGAYNISSFSGKIVSNPSRKFTVGSLESSSTTFLNGIVDDFRLYKRVLSDSEIAELATIAEETNNLTAYWEFDENNGTVAYDSSVNCLYGNLLNGPSWNDGKKGFSLSFDGVDDKVEVSANPSLEMGLKNMTISAWVKMPPAQLSYPTIVSKGGTSSANAGYWFYLSGDVIRFVFGDGTQRMSCTSNTVYVKDSQWHHVAVAIDRSSNAIFYVDGSNAGSVNVSAFCNKNILNETKSLTIGSAASSSASFLKGSIDGVRIFNTALDSQSIDSLAHIQDCDFSMFLTMDENTGNIAFDSTFNENNGILTNGPIWKAGIKGNSVQFDGRDDEVVCSASPELEMDSEDFSVAAWVNMGPSQANYSTVLSKGGYFGANTGYWLYLRNGVLHFSVCDGVNQYNYTANNNYITDNTWHHIAVTINRGGNLTFYVDGFSSGAFDATVFQNFNITNTSVELLVGSANYRPTFFKGKIDDFRLYKYALSATEIEDLANVPQQNNLLDISSSNDSDKNNLKVYPNPFISSVILSFSSEEMQNIQANIYSLNGYKIKTLHEGVSIIGENMLTWDGTDNLGQEVSKGMYVVQIISNDKALNKTIVKMR